MKDKRQRGHIVKASRDSIGAASSVPSYRAYGYRPSPNSLISDIQSTSESGGQIEMGKPSKLPTQVTNVAASNGTLSVVAITWTAAARAQNYRVYRSSTQGLTGALLATITATSYQDSTAAVGVTYWYSVQAINQFGAGPLSAQDSGSVINAVDPEAWRYAIVGTCIGYARNASGGLGGELRRVTTLADAGSGSLREACETPGAAWIIFDLSGNIVLTSEIQDTGNKTIDGRGRDITITKFGPRFGIRHSSFRPYDGAPTTNSIWLNIKFFDCIGNCQITIGSDAHDIWINNCQLQQMVDEGVYVGCALSSQVPPSGITMSWCKWVGQNRASGSSDKVMLISDPGLPQDAAATITMHHNWYNRMYARHPVGRYAKLHSFNNFFDKPIIGVDGLTDFQYLSENDIYDFNVSGAVPMVKTWVGGQVASGDPRGALSCKVTNPQLVNGATVQQVNTGAIFVPGYPYTPATADATLQAAIVAGAGWQSA